MTKKCGKNKKWHTKTQPSASLMSLQKFELLLIYFLTYPQQHGILFILINVVVPLKVWKKLSLRGMRPLKIVPSCKAFSRSVKVTQPELNYIYTSEALWESFQINLQHTDGGLSRPWYAQIFWYLWTLIKLTNRFQVAVRLFSDRSQMTSKCGKNKKVAYEAQPSVSLMCHILTSSVIYYWTDARQLGIYLFYIIKN